MKVVIQVNKDGHIVKVKTDQEAEIYIVCQSADINFASKIEPDFIFESGKAHESYMGPVRRKLEGWMV